jgi:type VI secretion system secreted protein VgrG
VEHTGTQGVDGGGKQGKSPSYSIRVEGIPETVQYRPARLTPVPRIYGTEMGTVDGEQHSPYAQIDSHGRYKVQFYFDENDPRNGKASTWVRMLQPHGGPNEGFHFPLRKDTEVLLVFLGGDPDRPVIAGVVPNAHTPSPVTVDNATHNVILTGGGSRIEIEDNDGGQYIKMTTPPESTLLHMGAQDGSGNNVHLSSMGHGLVELGGNSVIRIDGTQLEEIHQDLTEHYSEKQTITVGSDRSLTVSGTDTTTVTQDQTVNANANRLIYVTENQRHEIGANDEHVVTADQSFQVTGNQMFAVDGTQYNDVKTDLEETVGGKLKQTVTGDVSQTHLANFSQTVTGKSEVKVLSEFVGTYLGVDVTFKSQDNSETIVGIKNENIITAKIDSVLGLAMETIVGPKVAAHIGTEHEWTPLKTEKTGINLSTLDIKLESISGPLFQKTTVSIKAASLTIMP